MTSTRSKLPDTTRRDLSAALTTVRVVDLYHPWRRLREFAHVDLVWHDDGPAGLTLFRRLELSLRRDMTQAERRSTIAHEIVHLERGSAVRGYADREELEVSKGGRPTAASHIKTVGEALAWAACLDEAADELWVDRGTIRVRLEHLHPAERAYLRRRLGQDDGHHEHEETA